MTSVDNKRPLKVFLCHAHADRDPVRGLYSRLTKDGVDAWLDKAKLLPGQDWELEIRKAVREADVVVVCLSKQFNQAGFRQKEVRLALDTAMEKPEGEIFIIPARLEECETLESLRKWHWVDLFEEDGYEMLMRALRARADKIGVTLQVKNSWLPKVNNQPPFMKISSTPIEKSVESNQEKSKSKKENKSLQTSYKNIIGIKGFIIALVSLALFFAFQVPNRLAAAFPTATPTPTFTPTLTPTYTTFTPSPTVTLTPTLATGEYPATFYPSSTIAYFSDPELNNPSGAWSQLFYLCNRYISHQTESYLIASKSKFCGTSDELGWVNAKFIRLLFSGEFPQAFTTPSP